MAPTRAELKGKSKNELVDEVLKLRQLLREHMRSGESMEIEALVSSETHEPFVMMRWGDNAQQMKPAKAREMAAVFVESAEGAEADAALLVMLVERLEMNLEAAGAFIGIMRAEREKLGKRGQGAALERMGEMHG